MTLVESVRASGKRLTLQRQLVLEAVQRARHHVTADEIAREALEELGYVIHTHLDDRVTRWHRSDSHPHGHLVCRSCGGETEVRTAVLDAMARRIRTDYRFEPDLAHSAIVGVCRRCRAVPSP